MTDYTEYCSTQFEQLSYEEQFTIKKNQLKSMMSSFYSGNLDAFSSPSKHYRMRAEFRIWHDGSETFHIMFNQASKERIKVESLPSAAKLINAAMIITIDFVTKVPALRKKLFQIDYLSSTSNELVISLLYHKQLNDDWALQAAELINSLQHLGKINIIGRARKQKVVIGNDYVTESLLIDNRRYSFQQIENSFTQPNALINIDMIQWVIKHASDNTGDLLELYCGAGNFSVPLSHYFKRVLATEISKTSVKAAQHNIQQNDIENLIIARLSSEEFVEAYNKVRPFTRLANINLDDYNFSTVLVDPPRSGLDNTTLALVAGFDTIIYISCNPLTLVENLAELSKTHQVVKLALFDQFPFTHHMETGVILQRI